MRGQSLSSGKMVQKQEAEAMASRQQHSLDGRSKHSGNTSGDQNHEDDEGCIYCHPQSKNTSCVPMGLVSGIQTTPPPLAQSMDGRVLMCEDDVKEAIERLKESKRPGVLYVFDNSPNHRRFPSSLCAVEDSASPQQDAEHPEHPTKQAREEM